MQKPPHSKRVGDIVNEGIPSLLITHLERAKYEKRMTKGKELEVPEDSETVKSFFIDRTLSVNYIIVYFTGKWVICYPYYPSGTTLYS